MSSISPSPVVLLCLCTLAFQICTCFQQKSSPLKFRPDGHFKILQIADMHYANGATTKCKDVLPREREHCSDLNTTAFVKRLIAAEQPDLIVFTGDNIFGADTEDPIASLNAAFAPAIEAKTPWAAILGNHDQESQLTRRQIMEHIAKMDYTLSQVYPEGYSSMDIDGYGNYHLEVGGAVGSELEGKSIMNLYMLDSGDYSHVRKIPGYGWIQESQKRWFKLLSAKLQEEFQSQPAAQLGVAPALVYFHIPLVETKDVSTCAIVGVKQEGVSCADVNSGFFATMHEAGDARAIFVGHDHVNDFCGGLLGNIKVCYGGGVGYHAYGKAGWFRRARVVSASLRSVHSGIDDDASPKHDNHTLPPIWLGVDQISTWKRLNDPFLSIIDQEVLWSASLGPITKQAWWPSHSSFLILSLSIYVVLWLLFSYTLSIWPFGTWHVCRSSSQRSFLAALFLQG